MSVFFFKRLITLIATLVGASLVIFLVLEILPGNAAQMTPYAALLAPYAESKRTGRTEQEIKDLTVPVAQSFGESAGVQQSDAEIVPRERIIGTQPHGLLVMRYRFGSAPRIRPGGSELLSGDFRWMPARQVSCIAGIGTLLVSAYVLTDGAFTVPNPTWLLAGGALLVGILLLASSLRGKR